MYGFDASTHLHIHTFIFVNFHKGIKTFIFSSVKLFSL